MLGAEMDKAINAFGRLNGQNERGSPEEAPMNSFVLILVFLAPQGSGSGTAAMQIEFQNQQSCESFRDRVVAQWDGGVDAKRSIATRPRAYGLCVEKRP
jgi:hypothetical protein